MSHIFISYSRRDLNLAQRIVDALGASHLDAWIDWKSIPKGEDWEQEIYRGIEGADAFLFLISSDSVTSEMCNKEIDQAVRNGKRILPIFTANVENRGIYSVTEKFLQKGPKDEINRRNFILCRQGKDDFDKAMEEVQTTIRTDYEWLKYHTELQVKALKWEQTKDVSRLLRGKELRDAEEQLARAGTQKEPQPTELQRAYILASQRNEIRQRRRVTTGLGIGLVIVALLAVFAWNQRNSAVNSEATAVAERARAEEQARISLSRQLAAQSVSLMNADRDFELTLLLALESNSFNETKNVADVRDALRQTMNFAPQKIIRMEDDIKSTTLHPDMPVVAAISQSTVFVLDARVGQDKRILLKDKPVEKVLFSPDGNRLLAGVGGNYAYLWDGITYQQINILDASEAIVSIAFSNDSRMIITRGKTSIRIWDAANGNLMWKLQTGDISSYALSHNNRMLVTLSDNGVMQIWDTLNGMKISTYQHKNGVTAFAFSVDDQYIITGNQDQRIYFWNPRDFTIAKTLDQASPISKLKVDPSGKYLAVWYYDPNNWYQGDVWIWSLEQQTIRIHRRYSNQITDFCFDGTGNYFAVGNWDGLVEIFNLSQGTEVKFTSRAPVSKLLFNQDNSLLLIDNIDGTTYVLDPETATEQAKLRNADFLLDIFINKGNLVVSAGFDRTIRFWDINHFKIPETIKIKGRATTVLFNPVNPRQFAVGSDSGLVQVWDIGEGQYQLSYSHSFPIRDLRFSSSGKYVASLDDHGMLSLQSVLKKSNSEEWGNVGDFAFSPDGKWFFIAMDNRLIVSSLDPSIPARDVNFSEKISKLFLSPDGAYLIIAGKTEASVYTLNDVLQYDSATLVPVLKFQQNELSSAVFSHDGKWLATADSSNLLSIWNIQQRNRILYFPNTDFMDFSVDGLYFTTGDCTDGIRVWETKNWAPVIVQPVRSAACLYRYTIDSSGKKVLSTYSDGNVEIMDISTHNVSAISYHKVIDPFFDISASFSPSGTKIVTAGDDGIIQIIDVDSQQTTDTIFTGAMIADVLFSPDGKYVIATGQNQTIYIMESEIDNLKNIACRILSRNLTHEEWIRFLGNSIPYRKTCSNLPSGQ